MGRCPPLLVVVDGLKYRTGRSQHGCGLAWSAPPLICNADAIARRAPPEDSMHVARISHPSSIHREEAVAASESRAISRSTGNDRGDLDPAPRLLPMDPQNHGLAPAWAAPVVSAGSRGRVDVARRPSPVAAPPVAVAVPRPLVPPTGVEPRIIASITR